MLAHDQAIESVKNTGAITIQLAPPDKIRSWSYGEVTKPETINYRSFKPERDGLFCERIFGPVKNWECHCGKYKRIRYKGVVCDRCGVEVTHTKVRRERMGHIELAVPVVHIWFFKSTPSIIASMLGLNVKDLERVVYYESYIVIDAGDTDLARWQLITKEEFDDLEEEGRRFTAMMGAPAIKQLLAQLDLDAFSTNLRERISVENSLVKKQDLLKRLRIVDSFRKSKNRPEWMVLDVLPVIPPDLRPLVPLEGGRFATSDLNDLYRRVINRNNRLKRLIDIKAPEVILCNEKRMLQESVDVLFDNGRRSPQARIEGRRPLKSLAELLKGKSGRFRQNLLGKRVDYSGRSVIVVGPELKMHECGLPKQMALELYKPFIIQKLEEEGYVHTVKSARKFVEKERPEVWDILEQIIDDHPVLLNRAPTLHRLGIQAFYPRLIEGKAIRLHPLVCAAFNADFDGDQMAVHLPLSFEAQLECRVLMLSSNNILHPASGQPIAVPSQDIVLGLYYITKVRPHFKFENGQLVKFTSKDEYDKSLRKYYDAEEAIRAYYSVADQSYLAYDNIVDKKFRIWKDEEAHPQLAYTKNLPALSKPVVVRFPAGLKVYSSIAWQDTLVRDVEGKELIVKAGEKIENQWLVNETLLETSVGRCIFNRVVPQELGFANITFSKKVISKTVDDLYRLTGNRLTTKYLDDLKDIGFAWAGKSGLSPAICDMVIPPEKYELIKDSQSKVDQIMDLFENGVITEGERYNQVVDQWSHTTNQIANLQFNQLMADRDGFNPVYMMADSGARGSREQIKQLSGMRGLMAKPTKSLGGQEVVENPIKSNFREGLNVLEYFISTHGARKGLADTALKTADAGYLTRRLVDVAQDVVITEEDCHTTIGKEIIAHKDGDDIIQSLEERILGRVALNDIKHPVTEEVLVKANDVIDEAQVKLVAGAGIESVIVRSVLTCQSYRGVCARCYGRNLANGRLADLGEAVGVIAAQSIGEPGTQLTLRTFHTGGAASRLTVENSKKATVKSKVSMDGLQTVVREDGTHVVVSRSAELVLQDDHGIVRGRWAIPYGAELRVVQNQNVEKDDTLFEWDPYNSVIVATQKGVIEYDELVEGTTLQTDYDDATGMETLRVTTDRRGKLRPHINVLDPEGRKVGRYMLPEGAILQVRGGDKVGIGFVLVKIPRQVGKTKDITGGLPRVAELFEARQPKRPAVVAPNDGVVYYGPIERGQQRIYVLDEDDLRRFNEENKDDRYGRIPEDIRSIKSGIIWMQSKNAEVVVDDDAVADDTLVESEAPVRKRRVAVVREPREGIDFVFHESQSELIPRGKHIAVHDGDRVKAGEKLCEGSVNPHDILRVNGESAVQDYLVKEIQAVYRLQGVAISDKHIECIVRQMLRKVRVDNAGDSELLEDEELSRARLRRINEELASQEKQQVEYIPLLLGITRSSLATDSFISAASFQETTKVLTRAAVEGKVDELVGLKENVIMGRLIPSGTGAPHLKSMRVIDLDAQDEDEEDELQPETALVTEFDEE